VRELATASRLLALGLCVASVGVAACGSSVQTKTVTVSAPAQTTPITSSSNEQSNPSASAAKTSKPKAHSSATKPKISAYTWCDANIRVKSATTTCPFGENVFLAFWTNQNYDGVSVSAYSPAAHRDFAVDCTSTTTRVVCTAGDGGEVSFAQSAVGRYSLSQAKRYVASHDVGDNIFPWEQAGDAGSSDDTSTPSYAAPEATPSVPDTSSTPPGENIPNYDNGNGYRVQCADGTYSHSGGIQGACSHHGGVG
jgi:hypothetical protein